MNPESARNATPVNSHLLCRAGGLVVAIAGARVSETMRPLPVSRLPDVPAFVLGISVIRGKPTVVVDVQRLIGVPSNPTRFVTLRGGERRVSLAFDDVLDVRPLSGIRLETLPTLATIAEREFVESVGLLDDALLLVLATSRVVPESIWAKVESGGTVS